MPIKPSLATGGADATTLNHSAFSKRSRALLIWATVITLALNFVPYASTALYPLRLFVTFVHESGHALAALISGGSVESLQIMPTGAGLTKGSVAPWWTWLFLSGGYLGTALFGALMLQLGRVRMKGSSGRFALSAMGVAIAVITLLWGFHPTSDPFTLVVGAVLSAGLLGLGRVLRPAGADFLAAFLAVQCSLNALGDIRDLVTLTSMGHTQNDAVFMEKAYLLPAMFWGCLWAVAAVAVLFLSLRIYFRATAKNAPQTV